MHGSCVIKDRDLEIEKLITLATEQLWTPYFAQSIPIYITIYSPNISILRALIGISPPEHIQKGNKIHIKSKSPCINPEKWWKCFYCIVDSYILK
jgi:hypothetical protein